MRRSSLVLVTSALAFAVAGLPLSAGAQDTKKGEPGIPPAKESEKKRSGGRLRMGDLPGEDPAPEPAKPAPPEAPAKTEVEQWIDLLSKWPASEARQASLRLAGQAREASPHLVRAVQAKSDDWRRVCGAAATLGRIGDVSVLPLLVAKLQDRQMFTHSGDLLDAIVRIDPAGAKARLVAQLLHPASAVVAEAAKRLESRVGPPDVQDLRDVMEAAQDAGHAATRAAAAGLLAVADPAAARISLVPALRDPAPEVAAAAARLLAADDAPEAEEALRRAAQSSVDRQLAYAAVGLALRAERTGRRTIDDATLKLLLGGRGLSGLDPLSRAAAAVALADLGYYHEVPALDDVLDQRLVPELISVVAGTTFWNDMRVFQPLAVRRLQRLTGRSAGSTAAEWTAWWQQSGASFRATRVLLEVPAAHAASLSVSVRGPRAPGGEGTLLTACTEGLAWAQPGDFVAMLGAAEADALVQAVNASGALRSGEGGRAEGVGAIDLVVRAGRRERRMSLPADVAGTPAEALLAEVARLRAACAWQRYRPSSQPADLPTFVERMGPRFAPGHSDAERAATFADLVTSSIDESRPEAWNLRALEELRGVAGLEAAIGDEGTRRLLGNLGRRTALDAQAEALVLTLSRARRREAHPHLLDFLTTRASPRSGDLLVQVFRDASQASLADGLADERIAIRAAALASLSEASPKELAEDSVRKALKEADVTLRREAVRALGRLRCEWARDDVEKLAVQPGDLRAAAIEALGRLGGKRALPALMSAFASDDESLRVTAVGALAATREPEAIPALAIGLSMDPSPMVREVAARAIESLGTERAAAELRRVAMDRAQPAGPRARAVLGLSLLGGRGAARDLARLVDDPAAEVADQAALALAKGRDAAAVPHLLRMLSEGRMLRDARGALEAISLETFAHEDPDVVSSLYAGWWETSKERGPRGWLVDALVLGGLDDPALREWEAGRAGREAVPALVQGMRSARWSVRRACDLALREIGERSFGDIEPYTSAAEVARIAASWEDWFAPESDAAEGGR